MKKIVLLPLFFVLLYSCAGLQTSKNVITGAELIGYGILKVEISETINKNSTATGKYNVGKVKGIQERSDVIKLNENETFGIIYRVIGSPKGATQILTVKVIHPPIKGRTISTAKVYSKIGESTDSFYTFNETYELVEGEWLFQIWDRDKLLLEKAFVTKK